MSEMPSPTRVMGSRLRFSPWSALRSAVALGWMVRAVSSRHGGMYVARVTSGLGVLVTLVTVIKLAREFGPDQASLQITAWGAYGIAWVASIPAALALARRGRAAQAHVGFEALASARGLSRRGVQGAEIGACVESVAEVVLAPNVLLACVVWIVSASAPYSLEGKGRVLTGVVAFALIAAVVMGLVIGCCRCWGGRYGRLWFIAALLGPWILITLQPTGVAGAWLSVPGLLEQVWRTLTAV